MAQAEGTRAAGLLRGPAAVATAHVALGGVMAAGQWYEQTRVCRGRVAPPNVKYAATMATREHRSHPLAQASDAEVLTVAVVVALALV